MKFAALHPVKAAIAKAQANPVIAAQLVGFGVDIIVGFGAPVTPDLKLGAVGLVTTAATLFGHSQVVPINSLVAGTVTQSEAGQPVTIVAPDGATKTLGG